MKIHVTMSDRSPTVACEHGEPKVFLYLWSLSHRSAADSACLSAQQSFSLKNCPLTPETGQAGTSDEKFQAIQLYIYIYLTYIIYNIYTHCNTTNWDDWSTPRRHGTIRFTRWQVGGCYVVAPSFPRCDNSQPERLHEFQGVFEGETAHMRLL